jgi:tetratricopeptide (TPR) repeat protein
VTADDLAAASAHLAAGRPGEAAAAVGLHLATRPDDPWALQLLACAQLRAGKRMAGRETALRARALDPGAEWAWRLWAEASLRMGDVDDARTGMTEALRLAPDDWHVHADAVRLGLFPPDETRRHAAECLRLAPDVPDAYLVVAAVAVQDGRLSQARTAYRAALAIDPEHVEARRGIDDLEITAGRPEKAAVGALAQLADAPTSTAALVHLRSVVHQAVTGLGALPALLPWGLGVVLLGLSFASEDGSAGVVPVGLRFLLLAAALAGAGWWAALVARFARRSGLAPSALLDRLRDVSPAHLVWLGLQATVLALLVVACAVQPWTGLWSSGSDAAPTGPADVVAAVAAVAALGLSLISWLGLPVLGGLVSRPARRRRRGRR